MKTAGRGVLYITFAKVWFMLTGWALIFALPRIFKFASGGDAEAGQALFGEYKLVIMGVSFINNGIITGTIQAVSKFTSEDESNAGAIRRSALKVQGVIGIGLALAYAAFSVLLADWLGSPDLSGLMQLSAGIIAAYACYAVYIGSFNGQRLFHRQALFDIAYAALKTGLICALALTGWKVLGTVLGFLIASVIITASAALVSGRSGTAGSFPARRYFSFAAVLIAYTFLLNLVLSLDLFLLKGLASDAALSLGKSASQASELSKALAGQYGAAQGLAFIPYQAILSIAFVAFPMISKVTFADNAEKSRDYVRKTMRFSTLLIAGFAAVFTALPGQAIGFIFPPEYRVASEALAILSIGIAAFGLMVVGNTILNGAGLPGRAIGVVAVTLLAIVGAIGVLVPRAQPGAEALTATAIGSTLGMGLGLVASAIAVYRRFGAFWPIGTALRVGVAGCVAVASGRWLLPDAGRLATLAECILVFVLYFLVLAALREFTRADLADLRRVFRRG